MSRTGKYAVALAVLPIVGLSAYYTHGCNETRLFLEISPLFFLAAVFIALVPVFRAEGARQRIGWRLFFPPLIVIIVIPVIAFPVALDVGKAFADWRFPKCKALVRRIESNAILVSTNITRIPTEQAHVPLCEGLLAQRISDILVVEFDTDMRGFPAYEAGYIYCSGERIPKGSFAANKTAAQIQPHWFYFAR
jgi:hypothetical protein